MCQNEVDAKVEEKVPAPVESLLVYDEIVFGLSSRSSLQVHPRQKVKVWSVLW